MLSFISIILAYVANILPSRLTKFIFHIFTLLMGFLAASPLCAPLLNPLFCFFCDIDLTELKTQNSSPSAFPTLNALFARQAPRPLSPEVTGFNHSRTRTTSRPTAPLSVPCDSELTFEPCPSRALLHIKSRAFTLSSLLGPAPGPPGILDHHAALIFRLGPSDLHRIFAPCDCTIAGLHAIQGSYYPVQPRFLLHPAINVLGENSRLILQLCNPFLGPFYMVLVGACGVGAPRLSILGPEPGVTTLRQGEDMGYFEFGGSTVVLVLDRRRLAEDCDGGQLAIGSGRVRAGELLCAVHRAI